MRVGRAQITRAAVNILANSESVPASPFSSTFTSSFPRSRCFYVRTEEDRVPASCFGSFQDVYFQNDGFDGLYSSSGCRNRCGLNVKWI